MNHKHMLIGCSFTDPEWQTEIPWSLEYTKLHPSYIVAKAGMGIKGICTESLCYLKTLDTITKIVIILPTLLRMDIETNQEGHLCNAMVNLLSARSAQWAVELPAVRKWIVSGGLHFYNKHKEEGHIFDLLYKHQGYLVVIKEHLRALTILIEYCKLNNIEYYISAIQDPLDQLVGLEYIQEDVKILLDEVEYSKWFKFDGKFINKFLKHDNHPTTEEHRVLSKYIINNTQGVIHG